MISKEDVKKLADLSRIEISEDEIESLRGEMDSILEYVGQVKGVTGNSKSEIEIGSNYNVMRDDTNPTESGTYTKDLLSEAPAIEKEYIKVKKVL